MEGLTVIVLSDTGAATAARPRLAGGLLGQHLCAVPARFVLAYRRPADVLQMKQSRTV